MHKWSVRFLALVGSLVLSACGERLEGGAACPVLCSGQSVALRDTTVHAVVIDTTLSGFPPRGEATFLLLANSGDSTEARYVVRFDSIPSKYLKGTDSLATTSVDSAFVRLSIENSLSRFSQAVTFEVYDVDSSAPDSATSALIPLFRPDLLLGSVTIDSAALKDSVRIYLDNSRVGQKVSTTTRLRLGVRVRSAAPVRIAVFSIAAGAGITRLGLDPAPADTTVDIITYFPSSGSPASDPRVAVDFTDFNVFTGASQLPADVVGVGGTAGRRIYYRFNVPARITDSATIVRATLVLNQRPASTYGFTDSIIVSPVVVVASKEVADLYKAALLTDTLLPGQYPPGSHPSRFQLPSLRLPSGGSGERRFDLANVVSVWRSTSAERLPPAIILRSANESVSILEAQFYSIEAAAELRPRLVITYVPRSEFGLP